MTKTGTKMTKGSKSSDAKDAKNLVYGDINEPEVSENLKNKTDMKKVVLNVLQEVEMKNDEYIEEKEEDFLLIGLNDEEKEKYIQEMKKNSYDNMEDNDIIDNPFYVPLKGGSAVNFPKKDFYSSYSYCYALLLKNDTSSDDNMELKNINNKKIKIGELKKICKRLVLEKVNIKILHNNRFKRVTNLLSGDLLKLLFGENRYGKNYQDTEFVVPFYNLSITDAKNYLSLYETNSDITNLSSTMSTINSFSPNYTAPIDLSVEYMLKSLDKHAYWTIQKNCKFPLFEIFKDRIFTYNGVRLDMIKAETLNGAKNVATNINQLIDTIEKVQTNIHRKRNKNKSKNNNKKNEYDLPGNGVMEDYDKKEKKSDRYVKSEFQNLYKVLKNQKDRTFYVNSSSNLNITKDDITKIFDRITNDKYRFDLLNVLLTSKDYCHLVYNNKKVLERNADLFKKYKAFYSYAMFYAHMTLYLEESILSTKSTKYNRHVFDLETASCLPTFPFSKSNLTRNPYISLLLPEDVIDPKTNFVGLETPYEYDKYMGLIDPVEAKRRFNIFCTGSADKDLFNIEGIDQNKIAVSGSMMTACLQKLSPLFEKCSSPDEDYETRWKSFFRHFYGDSDIDLMCMCESMTHLISYGTKFITHIMKTLDIKRDEITIKPQKKSAIIISKHFFLECLDDINNAMETSYTTESLIELFTEVGKASYSDEFEQLLQEYFYTDYTIRKKDRNCEWRKSKQRQNIVFDSELERAFTNITPFDDFDIKMSSYDIPETGLKKQDNEIYFFVNDFRDESNKVEQDKNYLLFKYSESLKFKVTSKKMNRDVEMFKVKDCDPFNTVARFHLPCVRAYYQNSKFYMLPSFITAMHSGINIDYKYFAGSRDPVNICQKYITRGFGIILNTSEKKGIITYTGAVDEYNGMYKSNDATEIFGPKDLNHNYFCPGVFKLGLDRSVYRETGMRMMNSDEDVKECLKKESKYDSDNSPIDIFAIKTVTKTGDVACYKNWVADAFYDQSNL